MSDNNPTRSLLIRAHALANARGRRSSAGIANGSFQGRPPATWNDRK